MGRDRVVLKTGLMTLEEVRNAREMSGDYPIFTQSGRLVLSDSWLWEWEKKNPHCYAQQVLKAARLNLPTPTSKWFPRIQRYVFKD